MATDPDNPLPRVDASVATVRRQFEARAAAYGRHDALVREVGRRMLERLALMRLPVQTLVDLGCGAGHGRAPLLQQFAQARWLGVDVSDAMLRARAPGTAEAGLRGLLGRFGGAARRPWRVCADAAQLPLPDASIDCVFSNLMLHWHPAPHRVIGEMARVLRTGGLVLFSSYGPDTLAELREACREALPRARPMPYVDMHDLGDMLVQAGFEAPVMEVEHLHLTYAGAPQLLAEVRALGGNPRNDRPRGLPSGRQARALLEALRGRADRDGRIGLRFEIVVGHGWRVAPRTAGVSTISMPRRRG